MLIWIYFIYKADFSFPRHLHRHPEPEVLRDHLSGGLHDHQPSPESRLIRPDLNEEDWETKLLPGISPAPPVSLVFWWEVHSVVVPEILDTSRWNPREAHPATRLPVVGGRLLKHANNWEILSPDPWVLHVIQQGYKIGFIKELPRKWFFRSTPIPKSWDQCQALEKNLLPSRERLCTLSSRSHLVNYTGPLFSSPQENRYLEADFQHQGSEQDVHPTKEIQNGNLAVILLSLQPALGWHP